MSSNFTELHFSDFIANTLATHPEWLNAGLHGISSGMAMALEIANKRAAKSDGAMMAALALSRGGRIGKDLKKQLLAKVATAINPNVCSTLEQTYLDEANAND